MASLTILEGGGAIFRSFVLVLPIRRVQQGWQSCFRIFLPNMGQEGSVNYELILRTP